MANSKKNQSAKPANGAAAKTAANGAAKASELGEIIVRDDIEFIKLSKDIFGNVYLPGQEPVVVLEIFKQAREYEEAKTERMRLSKIESDGKTALAGLSRKYRAFFEESADHMQFQYPCGGVVVEVDRSEAVVTRKESSAKPEKKRGKKEAEEQAVY